MNMISAAAQFAFDIGKRNADLQNENFRLRAALEKYVDKKAWIEGCCQDVGHYVWYGDGDNPWEIAQKALEGKDE